MNWLVYAVGGTLVTVTGTNFVNATRSFCRFDVKLSKTTFITASLLTCVAPAAAGGAGAVTLAVSNNNVDFSATTPFTYDGALGISFFVYFRIICVCFEINLSLRSCLLPISNVPFVLSSFALFINCLQPLRL